MTKGSLRYVLLRRLLLSANIAILLLLPLIYQLFRTYAIDAYDQELSEAGFSLVPYLAMENDKPRFSLPAEAEQVFRTDQYDENFFLILGPGNKYIAGDADLPIKGLESSWRKQPPYVLYDAVYRDKDIRVSAFRHVMNGQVFLVVAAETTNKRDRIMLKIFLGLILPLFVLALVNGLAIWHGIRLALAPIEDIRIALQDMQQGSLVPLAETSLPSEIKPLVQEFNALLLRLDETSLAQQQFVANAAHQLRTPLAGIRTQLEVIRDESTEVQHQQRVARCVDAVAKLNHLVHQMLALLTATPGARDIPQDSIADVAAVIRERSADWVRLAVVRDIDLGFELSTLHVRGDAMLVGEMIANLVENAINYTPVSGMVTVRCSQTGAQGVIEVEDDGPGIPEGERQKVLQRFYRLPGASTFGSGLGLSIVQEIVRGLEGEIQILTPLTGRGCLMRVELPAALT